MRPGTDTLDTGRPAEDGRLNYAALLGVIALASFAAPLATRVAVAFGMRLGLVGPLSLTLAVLIVTVWLLVARGGVGAAEPP